MGITHSSKQKHKLTEGRMPIHRKKESLKWGHQPSITKLGDQKIFRVGGRGSGYKYRALKLNEGNFMLVSEGVSRKCKILEVLYNTRNNELAVLFQLILHHSNIIDIFIILKLWLKDYLKLKILQLKGN